MSLPPEARSRPASLRERIFSLPTLLSFAVAVGFIYLLATRFDLDWARTWENVRSMDLRLYAVGVGLYYLSFVFRGARWRVLVGNAVPAETPGAHLPTVPKFSQLILIGWFVNAVAWLRLGDAYRAYALSDESGGDFSFGLGTILGERFLDMVTVLALMVLGVGWYSSTRDAGGLDYIVAAALLMSLALAALIAAMLGYGPRLARVSAKAVGLVLRLIRRSNSELPGRVEAAYNRFHNGALGSLKRLPTVFVLGLLAWIMEVGRVYFVVLALDMEVSVSLVVITALGHAILSTVPTPGGIGAVEPGVTGLLALGLPRHDAASVALVDRSVTYLSVLAIGSLAFLLLQASQARRRRRRSAATQDESASS